MLPAIDGWVECDMWDGAPTETLPMTLFEGGISSPFG